MKLGYHFHEWTIYPGLDHSLRICYKDNCLRTETQMWDFSKKRLVWVEGNFVGSVTSPVFIIADTTDALKKMLPALPEETTAYYFAHTMHDLEVMMGYVSPRFILAEDYTETELARSPEFRKFLVTRHF